MTVQRMTSPRRAAVEPYEGKKKRPYHLRPILIHRRVKNGANVIGNRSSTSDNNFFSIKTCRVGYVMKLYAYF